MKHDSEMFPLWTHGLGVEMECKLSVSLHRSKLVFAPWPQNKRHWQLNWHPFVMIFERFFFLFSAKPYSERVKDWQNTPNCHFLLQLCPISRLFRTAEAIAFWFDLRTIFHFIKFGKKRFDLSHSTVIVSMLNTMHPPIFLVVLLFYIGWLICRCHMHTYVTNMSYMNRVHHHLHYVIFF